jgi:hypothetical protein
LIAASGQILGVDLDETADLGTFCLAGRPVQATAGDHFITAFFHSPDNRGQSTVYGRLSVEPRRAIRKKRESDAQRPG